MLVVKGNVLESKDCIIPHVCNDAGGFGSGFAYAVKNKYPKVRDAYREWYKTTTFDGMNYELLDVANEDLSLLSEYPFKLGQIQVVPVKNKFICNMIAQSTPGGDVIRGKRFNPIRYECLEECMYRVLEWCDLYKTMVKEPKICCPRFGTGLAGGDKQVIEDMIKNIWSDYEVTIFELE